MTPVGDRYLLGTGDGDLYLVSEAKAQHKLEVRPIAYKVPIDDADFEAAEGKKFEGASFRVADVLVQEYGRYFGMPTACFRGGCLTGPAHAGTELPGQIGKPFHIQRLGRLDNRRHGKPYVRGGRARVAHHARQDVGVEHTLDGDAVSGALQPGHPPDRVDQGFAVMRSGAPHERAVDIEQH